MDGETNLRNMLTGSAKSERVDPRELLQIVNGKVMPGPQTIRLMVEDLRGEIETNENIKTEWEKNPRAVLADRGFPSILQSEILNEAGIGNTALESCASTSSCCCSTM